MHYSVYFLITIFFIFEKCFPPNRNNLECTIHDFLDTCPHKMRECNIINTLKMDVHRKIYVQNASNYLIFIYSVRNMGLAKKITKLTLNHLLKRIDGERIRRDKDGIPRHYFRHRRLLRLQPLCDDSSSHILKKKTTQKTVNDTKHFMQKKKQKTQKRTNTLYILTLSVRIPASRALESVSKTASMRRAAMRLQASETVVPSGMVSALDNRSFLTVLSPPSSLTEEKRLDLKRKRKNRGKEEGGLHTEG